MINYLITVVLSAFLLFMVQPLIGKVILPWFGGSAGVWSAVLLFFQFMLLLGYTYSFLISTYLDRSKQILVHSAVVAFSFILLMLGMLGDWIPLLPSVQLKPAADTYPIIRILLILGSSVGIPYFVLSTTSPLLQSWYAVELPEKTPYWLYALSNGGSFVALVSYPFIIEPILTVTTQARLWSLAYFIFVLSVGFFVRRVWTNKTFLAVSATNKEETQTTGTAHLPAVRQRGFSLLMRDKTRQARGKQGGRKGKDRR